MTRTPGSGRSSTPRTGSPRATPGDTAIRSARRATPHRRKELKEGVRHEHGTGLLERLIGAWELVSYTEETVDDGDARAPLGERPHGLIMYTPDSSARGPCQRDPYGPDCSGAARRRAVVPVHRAVDLA
ncbi:hypothetical protein BOG92_050240 [Streptomyces sp. WAC00263]|nr:hypothetical protein BOG92_050240 [Streptomyces sp. WAC00263]